MGLRTEYISNLIVSYDDVQKMQTAQLAAYDYICGLKSYNELVVVLGTAATILGLIFIKSTAVGVAAGLTSLLSGMSSSEKETLKDVTNAGVRGLASLSVYMYNNRTRYNLVKADFPFLKFVDENMTVVQGEPEITSVHNIDPPGWIV